MKGDTFLDELKQTSMSKFREGEKGFQNINQESCHQTLNDAQGCQIEIRRQKSKPVLKSSLEMADSP